MKLIVIASGSRANAAVIENNGDAVLVDCGVTLKALRDGLAGAGLSLASLRAVFITHSHSDHIKGLPVLRRALDVPFYSAVDIEYCRGFEGDAVVGDFTVRAYECSHDVPCVGYKITCGEKSFCIATDTGVVTDAMRRELYGCESVMIESNHDIDMLKGGIYPARLKARILSPSGHLSNTDCARFVTELAQNGLKRAVLAHISENNNTPLLARAGTEQMLRKFVPSCRVSVYPAKAGLVVEL